jgi:hypothetical protein
MFKKQNILKSTEASDPGHREEAVIKHTVTILRFR